MTNWLYILGIVFFIASVGISLFILQRAKQKMAKQWEDHSLAVEEAKKASQEQLANLEAELVAQAKEYIDATKNQRLKELDSHLEREYNYKTTAMKEDLRKYSEYVDEEMRSLTNDLFARAEEARAVSSQLTGEIEDAAARLVSLVESERILLLDREEQKTHMLQLAEGDIEDIQLFMDEILPRMRRPEVIRKLIWAEYIDKPTTALLNRIVPKEVSGIYKITCLLDKKAYIGRSVNVRQRLSQHIKSSVGVGTIADQLVHHSMRKEGLENFMFEVLEECEREKLSEREKYYIGIFETDTWGYNASRGG